MLFAEFRRTAPLAVAALLVTQFASLAQANETHSPSDAIELESTADDSVDAVESTFEDLSETQAEDAFETDHHGRGPRHPAPRPRPRPPRRAPRPYPRPIPRWPTPPYHPPYPNHSYTCYAENLRGEWFSETSFDPQWAQREALEDCYAWGSADCRPLGCN
jgi:hypothetical protein